MNAENKSPSLEGGFLKPKPAGLSASRMSAFNVDAIKHDFIRHYKPQLLAMGGGEHVVYEIPEHPGIVVKAVSRSIRHTIDWNIQHGKSPDSLSEDLDKLIHEYLSEDAERFQKMRDHYGDQHVLNQKQFLVKLPVTPEILTQIYKGKPPVETNEAWGIVTVQRKSVAVREGKHLALVSGYSEAKPIDLKVYNTVTKHLVFGENPEKKTGKNEFLQMQWSKFLSDLVEQAALDEGLRDSLKEFVHQTILYTEKGEILDLAGPDNVVFYRNGNQWSYQLLDAFNSGGTLATETKDVIQKIGRKESLTPEERADLLISH